MSIVMKKEKDVISSIESKIEQDNQLIKDVSDFSIEEQSKDFRAELRTSPKIDELTSKIDVNDFNSIVKFGDEAAKEISECSKKILESTNVALLNDSGRIMVSLDKIMKQVDLADLKQQDNKERKGLSRLLDKGSKKLEKTLAKYGNMDTEISKIYIQIQEYDKEIDEANKKLDELYRANMEYYKNLVEYIVAAERGCEEIQAGIDEVQAEVDAGDTSMAIEVQGYIQAKQLLEQRAMDLRTAENVALQSVPMLKSIAYQNAVLKRKFSSTFIITLPAFRTALAQAVMIKRNAIQAQAMRSLDETTNELLRMNAQNTANNMRDAATMANETSIKVETLEENWNTILQGINDVKKINEDGAAKREDYKKRLDSLIGEYQKTLVDKVVS